MSDREALHTAMDADDTREEAALSDSAAAETLAFAAGEGVGETSGRTAERADVLAYLARRKANAAKIAQAMPEFEDEARWIARNIDVLSDYLRGGLHEGSAFTASLLAEEPSAAIDPYPFTEHRSVAELDSGRGEA